MFVIFFIGFAFILQRLFVIQILNTSQIVPLQKYLRIQRTSSLRGELLDRNGKPLVLNRKMYTVYGNINDIKENEKVENVLKKELQIEESTMSALLKQKDWKKIKTGVTEPQRKRIEKYYPQFLNFEDEWSRYYPEGSMSAHLLGFVGKDSVGEPKGYLGMEGYFDQELRGLPIIKEQESDVFGIPLIGGIFNKSNKQTGVTIYSSIDSTVQRTIERSLYEDTDKFGAEMGCAIAMEPYSGEILGMGCVPGFDPREYYKADSNNFINPLVSAVYEPGSTFKPLIVAMGIEEKKVTPQTIIHEKGPELIGDYEVRTWDNTYKGDISLTLALAKSSNVGMVQVIKKLSKQTVSHYLDILGLRSPTGIELEGEVSSLIKDINEWYPIDFATLSFGQGIAITPIQLIRSFASLTNGGYLVRPTVVRKMTDVQSSKKIPYRITSPRRIFSEKTAQKMKAMLYKTIENSEAYWPNKLPGYNYCGKTGTAQVATRGTYDASKTVASFIGFVPCERPKFLLFVMYKEPKSSPWGSETAAPTFFDIAKSLILYYNIAPER
ncbi:MAG: penicillin-binding protein 2 [Patescibacteria group bacterium]